MVALSLILAAAAPRNLAIVDVNVIDVRAGAVRNHQTILTSLDRIVWVGDAKKARIPRGTTRIDGRGRYAIPGLWDMHAHAFDRDSMALFTANGVTGARIMFGNPSHLAWRKAFDTGSAIGPRLRVGSPIIDGPQPIWPGSITVGNAEQGRAAIEGLVGKGYDFAKVYSLLPREGYFAIVETAKKLGMPFEGHVPNSIDPSEASEAGQRTIEHLTRVAWECSGREPEVRRFAAENTPAGTLKARALVVDSYDPRRAEGLYATFKKNETWQCPTLTVLRAMAFLDQEAFRADPRVKYVNPLFRASWDPTKDFRLKARTPEDWAVAKRAYRQSLRIVGEMHQAGVPLLAGTDCGNPFCFAGFSLHDELGLLVQAGLSPAAALRTATLNPAQYLGQTSTMGTLEVGRVADVVLLDRNPLANIDATQKIRVVVQRGRLFDRKALDRILAQTEVKPLTAPPSGGFCDH
ncbi:MAG TPA: amidohydrolase family protein [Fimbriimonadaceae bacterium]|nr:amidohydrolase family protein [Fimbriimonadaceae bacterium]